MIFHINAIIFSVSITVQKFIKKIISWDINIILDKNSIFEFKIYDF